MFVPVVFALVASSLETALGLASVREAALAVPGKQLLRDILVTEAAEFAVAAAADSRLR